MFQVDIAFGNLIKLSQPKRSHSPENEILHQIGEGIPISFSIEYSCEDFREKVLVLYVQIESNRFQF